MKARTVYVGRMTKTTISMRIFENGKNPNSIGEQVLLEMEVPLTKAVIRQLQDQVDFMERGSRRAR